MVVVRSRSRRIVTRLRSALRNPRGALRVVRRAILRRVPSVAHAGNRSIGRVRRVDGDERYEKRFTASSSAEYRAELDARRRWGLQPWMVPIIDSQPRSIFLPKLPQEFRLDRLAPTLSEHDREEVARQAISATFDMFVDGYAHRDLQARNLFSIDGQLQIIDFEMAVPYPSGARPAFPRSYDLVGEGMPSPYETHGACYSYAHPSSLARVLDVPLERALQLLRGDLELEARESSISFKKHSGRHECVTGLTYSSISLPHFQIPPERAQRNCARRFQELGITAEDLAGRRVLDFGCNIGGMLFESLRFEPACALGIEYDADKVRTARRIAAFAGVGHMVEFRQGDVDEAESRDFEAFDVVFCFAIERHVRRPERLLGLLSEVTRSRLYFEGNSTTNTVAVARTLKERGFAHVEVIGPSTDDVRFENHNRPLLVASRR